MCYDPYIAISQTDVEKEIKDALGLDATLDIGEGGGGYVTVLEALSVVGEITREDFREVMLDGLFAFLMANGPWLKRKVAEYMEEQARLQADLCPDCKAGVSDCATLGCGAE